MLEIPEWNEIERPWWQKVGMLVAAPFILGAIPAAIYLTAAWVF